MLRKLFFGFGIIIIVGVGLFAGFSAATIQSAPNFSTTFSPDSASKIYDSNGHVIKTVYAEQNREFVPLGKVPKHLQDAFIASEDVRFYSHWGIDPKGIFRAIWINITGGQVSEGASTITQQLARNTVLSHDQTYKRKIQEVWIAFQIERNFTKKEILEFYLNQIYFGQGAYGVQAAAKTYFGKNVEELTLAESAMLAGIPRSPNYYSPSSNLAAAKAVQSTVLDQMVKYSYITAEQAEEARKADITITTQKSGDDFATYFVDYVLKTMVDKYGANKVYKEGLHIYTTLDPDTQRAAEQAIERLPTFSTEKGLKQPQGALVAINPANGHILAMVGGRGGDQFNRATQAIRQPGSAFKPFVYLAALEHGYTPYSMVDDSPVYFDGWSPTNYDGSFRGALSLKSAFAKSINTVAVKLTNQVGIDQVIYNAQQMGISTLKTQGEPNDNHLAIALGGLTNGVTPLELTAAYGTIANHGVYVKPTPIIKVVDKNGVVLEENIPVQKAVFNERVAYQLTQMMEGVIEYGTGTAASINRPAAGKTGTTSNYFDAWFVGFTPDIVCGVWMGHDMNEPLHGITGGGTPAQIWRDFMLEALKDKPKTDFVRPSGIIEPLPAESVPEKPAEKPPEKVEKTAKPPAIDKKVPEKDKKIEKPPTKGQKQ